MPVDETPVRYLAPGNGNTKQDYFWAVNRPGGEVIYQWEISPGGPLPGDGGAGGFQGHHPM